MWMSRTAMELAEIGCEWKNWASFFFNRNNLGLWWKGILKHVLEYHIFGRISYIRSRNSEFTEFRLWIWITDQKSFAFMIINYSSTKIYFLRHAATSFYDTEISGIIWRGNCTNETVKIKMRNKLLIVVYEGFFLSAFVM